MNKNQKAQAHNRVFAIVRLDVKCSTLVILFNFSAKLG